jgi:hypothetical protein
MPIPIFAFEQFPFSEAFKAEGRDVHGFGCAVEDKFDQTRARGGGRLEACAAQPAGEIKPVQPRGAVDGALVGRDAVAPDVDGVQAALFDFGNTLHHLVDQLFKERGRGCLVFGVGRFAAQRFVFARGKDERTTLGAIVAIDDVVNAGGDATQRRRTVEERDIVRPRLERNIEVCEAGNMLCPRPGRVDDDGRVVVDTFVSADAPDFASHRVDGSHFTILDERCAIAFGGFDERVGREGRVGIARIGFVGGIIEMFGDEVREEFPHFVHGDDRRVDANALLIGDVAAQLIFMLGLGDLQKACLLKSAISADALLPIAEIDLITLEGQVGFGGEVVVHADESAGVTGRSGCGDLAFEDGGFESPLGEVEGNAGAHHPCADDDGIVGLSHSESFLPRISRIITD